MNQCLRNAGPVLVWLITLCVSACGGGGGGSGPPALQVINVTTTNPTIAAVISAHPQFIATGTYTDGSTRTLTTQVNWSTSNKAVATISNAPGSQGVATSTGIGSTTVTATLGGISGVDNLTVTANEWTWVSGASTVNARGIYGTRGVAAAGNVPGARETAMSWTDGAGNFWLFGGLGFDSMGNGGYLNDLWRYDPTTGLWTWMSGSAAVDSLGAYGTLGTEASGNVPSARVSSVTWTDSGGNLWMFGGVTYASPEPANDTNPPLLNDLWRYDPASGLWTWMSGSDNPFSYAVYGTQGVAAPSNVPGSRYSAMAWTDGAGNFWLLGGFWTPLLILDDTMASALNDLWQYGPVSGMWTWVGGHQLDFGDGNVCASQGKADVGNMPGSRSAALTWTDNIGNLWLFGGSVASVDVSNGGVSYDVQNDLWMYSPITNLWTCFSGAKTQHAAGVYGSQGVAAISNVPGARSGSVSWTDSAGNLWLSGGSGVDSAGTIGNLNDLWVFSPITSQWTWESGSTQANASGVAGMKGVTAAGSVPGARYGAISWRDSAGNLWLFGGYGFDSNGKAGDLNDLWKF